MIGACDLRESFGLSAVGFVAARADDSRVGGLRLQGCGIISMLALRPVAGFAGNIGVASELLLIDDVGVASFADFVSGERRSSSGDLSDGITAVVSILAKTLGDDSGPQQDEDRQKDNDYHGETDEVLSVLEHGCLPGRAAKRLGPDTACDLGYRG